MRFDLLARLRAWLSHLPQNRPPRYSGYVLTTPDQRTAALRLWRELTGCEPIDYDDAFHREGTFDSLGLRERTAALVLFGSKAVLEKRDSVKKSLHQGVQPHDPLVPAVAGMALGR